MHKLKALNRSARNVNAGTQPVEVADIATKRFFSALPQLLSVNESVLWQLNQVDFEVNLVG